MGVEISGGDGVNLNASDPNVSPIQVGYDYTTQVADIIKILATSGATTLQLFGVTASGKLCLLADDLGGPPDGGIALIHSGGTTGTETLTDSITLYETGGRSAGGGATLTGAYKVYFPAFTPSGAKALVMLADDRIDTGSGGDVANGWVIGRSLMLSSGGTLTLQNTSSPLVFDDGGSQVTLVPEFGSAVTATIPNQGGFLVVRGNSASPSAGEMAAINLTSQSATATGNITNACNPGYYRVHYTLEDTSTQVGVATVQFAIAYTDDAGATTQAGAALSLTATGRDRGSFEVYLASGDITWSATVVGVVGTGRYALRARTESLG